LRDGLGQKDAAAIAAIKGIDTDMFLGLLGATGPAGQALQRLQALELPADAKLQIEGLSEVITAVTNNAPDLKLTIDPVEIRGYEYHEGVTFSLFAESLSGELGRGGRYRTGNGGGGGGEPSTGFTLFVDALLRALPKPHRRDRVFLPAGLASADAERLRDDGWATIQAMDEADDGKAEARRLECTHIFEGGTIHALKQD
jgi:ATP phosphoribosyltransferase regulatory subunit